MQYIAILHGCKNDNSYERNVIMFLFLLKEDQGYTRAVLTSIHTLCFKAKIKPIKYTPVHLIITM